MSDSKTLLRAVEIIERRGWVQNTWISIRGVCTESAVLMALRNTMNDATIFRNPEATGRRECAFMKRLTVSLNQMSGTDYAAPRHWNDSMWREKKEVLFTLRSIARQWEDQDKPRVRIPEPRKKPEIEQLPQAAEVVPDTVPESWVKKFGKALIGA